jgi:proton-translocating NADH-quinone oxidoreductase chain M
MHLIAYISISFLVIPLFAILINNLFSRKYAEKIGIYLAGAVSVIQIASSIAVFILLSVSHMHEFEFSLLWDLTKASSERFSVNALSLVILFCIGLVSFVSVLIANQTIKKKRTLYVTLLMTLILGMNGMVIVTDLMSLYIFLEVVGISSFVLIAMFKSETGLEGAFKYLVMSAMASIFIMTGLAFIFMQTGSLQYDQVGMSVLNAQSNPQPFLIYTAFILMIAGFAIKAGAVPFHSWLPDAHQSADTSISVLLSGIVIKVAGMYGFIILIRLFDKVPAINMTLAVIGTVTIIVGALYALRQDHFKRIVAYSSVSQMGYIMLGISTGSILGLLGAVVHIFNHATVKSTLFSNAAALHEQAGTLDIKEMGGLQKKMPVTGISSIAAFLSMTGIPPFAGFWSKLLIVMALWDADSKVFAGIALFASIFTAAYFLRMQKKVFFGILPDKYKDLKEVGGSIRFAEIMLTVIMTAVGIFFPLALIYLKGRGIL